MSPWLLLLMLTVVWAINLCGAVMSAHVDDTRNPVPDGSKRGVSVFPAVLMLFVAWAIALVSDCFAKPWGSYVVGGIHVIFGLVMVPLLVRDLRFLRSGDRPAA